MSKQFTLGKDERLKSRKQIEQLFTEGKTITVAPFKIFYLIIKKIGNRNSKCFIQFGAGVSVKNFKKAVERNRIKRLTREAFRLQKLFLQKKLDEQGFQMNIFFIFTGKEIPDFNLVKEKTAVALKRLLIIIDENISSHS